MQPFFAKLNATSLFLIAISLIKVALTLSAHPEFGSLAPPLLRRVRREKYRGLRQSRLSRRKLDITSKTCVPDYARGISPSAPFGEATFTVTVPSHSTLSVCETVSRSFRDA